MNAIRNGNNVKKKDIDNPKIMGPSDQKIIFSVSVVVNTKLEIYYYYYYYYMLNDNPIIIKFLSNTLNILWKIQKEALHVFSNL